MTLKRIFFIYSEASMAVLMAVAGLIEMICAGGLWWMGADWIALVAFGAGCALWGVAGWIAFWIWRVEVAA